MRAPDRFREILASTRAAVQQGRAGIALGFLAYVSWGLLSPVGKELLELGYRPLGLNAVRFLLATVPLLVVLGPRAVRESLRLAASRDVLVPNLLANASLTLFLYSLVLLEEPTHVTLGFYTAPLFTALLASWFLGERVGPWFVPAVAALLGGGYLALFGLALPPPGFGTLGMALSVLSAVVWALYTVTLRKAAPDLPLRPLVGAAFLIGTAWFVLLSLVVEGLPGPQSATSWGWMALYVAVPTLASFILFNASLRLAPAGTVNLLVGVELAATALFSALLFGARFDGAQVAGLVLVMAGVTWYLWIREPRPAYGPV